MAFNKAYETEEDTKARDITPALAAAGWPQNLILMEYSLKKDRFKIVPEKNVAIKIPPTDRNFPDYILCKSVNFPIAVVEAKRSSKSAADGIDQAIKYAQMLDVPFAYASAGEDFIEYNFHTGQQRHIPLDAFPTPQNMWKRWCEARGVQPEDEEKFSDGLYYTTSDGITPRYYQMVAINRTVNAVIADHRKRLLLVMATGTGKTYTAFQIVWRLRKAGVVKNVLYLADRNQLIDQTIIGDFSPMSGMTKIKHGKIETSYQIFFGLYQQLKGRESDEGESSDSIVDNFRQVPPDYFDLIIVDECHRGSAREESSWRDILTYFDSAIQIGLTATPNENNGADNTEYFGDPIYTYSLKQGIEDGFLAPFQVVNINFDKDRDGWEPQEGETDEDGKLIPKRTYTLNDFGTVLELKQRTNAVARKVTSYLQHIGRMSKTIIFCTTQRHAINMRDAMREINADMMRDNPTYCVRMTADDEEGRGLYQNFCSVSEPYPVVVTTSKLLSTGADTKCVKLIVLDSNIVSQTEFKQIIGRGTRLREDAGKTFFTILDFRNVTSLFSDPDFDGNPDIMSEWGDGDPDPKPKGGNGGQDGGGSGGKPPHGGDSGDGGETVAPEKRETYTVSGVEVTIVGTSIQYLDDDGKMVTSKFLDYTRKNILDLYKTEADFIEVWNGPEEKKVILRLLADRGVLIEHLRKELKNPDVDEFDLIRQIAFEAVPVARSLRASKVKRSRFLEKYQGVAREVLEKLLDIYARVGVREIDNISVLKNSEFAEFKGLPAIVRAFGGKENYMDAVKGMEAIIYSPTSETTNNYKQVELQ